MDWSTAVKCKKRKINKIDKESYKRVKSAWTLQKKSTFPDGILCCLPVKSLNILRIR